MGYEKTAVKIRRPFDWAAIIFYQKTVKGTHISSTIIPMRPSRGSEGSGVGRAQSLNDDEGRDARSSEQGRAPAGQGLWCAGGRGGEGRRGSGREREDIAT